MNTLYSVDRRDRPGRPGSGAARPPFPTSLAMSRRDNLARAYTLRQSSSELKIDGYMRVNLTDTKSAAVSNMHIDLAIGGLDMQEDVSICVPHERSGDYFVAC